MMFSEPSTTLFWHWPSLQPRRTLLMRPHSPLPAPRERPALPPDHPRGPPLTRPRANSIVNDSAFCAPSTRPMARPPQRAHYPERNTPLSFAVPLPLAPRSFSPRARVAATAHSSVATAPRVVLSSVATAPDAVPFFATSAAAGAITTATCSVGAVATHAAAMAMWAPLQRTLWPRALSRHSLWPGR